MCLHKIADDVLNLFATSLIAWLEIQPSRLCSGSAAQHINTVVVSR